MDIYISRNKIFGGYLRIVLFGLERFFAKVLLLYRIFAIIIVFFTGCCISYCLKCKLLLSKKIRGCNSVKMSIILLLSSFAKIQVRA